MGYIAVVCDPEVIDTSEQFVEKLPQFRREMVDPAASAVHFVAQVEDDELAGILRRELVDVGDDILDHTAHSTDSS